MKTNDLQAQLAASCLCLLSCLHKYLVLSHPLSPLSPTDNSGQQKIEAKDCHQPPWILQAHMDIYSGIHLFRKCQQSSARNLLSDKFSYSSVFPLSLSDVNLKGSYISDNIPSCLLVAPANCIEAIVAKKQIYFLYSVCNIANEIVSKSHICSRMKDLKALLQMERGKESLCHAWFSKLCLTVKQSV